MSGFDSSWPFTFSLNMLFQISGSEADNNAVLLEVENHVTVGSVTLHRVSCVKNTEVSWQAVHTAKVIAVCGNRSAFILRCIL